MTASTVCSRVVALVVSVAAIATSSRAQWSAVRLGGSSSVATDVANGQQVGYVNFVAAQWTGTPGSVVFLGTATGASGASATDGVHQVGVQDGHAALWSGSAASFIDLDPGSPSMSTLANGVSGNVQVGNILLSAQITHAAMWTGSAASFVDLNPTGATWSDAADVDGGQIVGVAIIQDIWHAGVWTGSASSFVSLNRPEFVAGECYGVHAGRQVGYAKLQGGLERASLWSSTAASWIDLNPPGELQSIAYDVFVAQVGAPHVVGTVGAQNSRACYWNGSASTFVDLQPFLPDDTNDSAATGVWVDAQTSMLYVSGYRVTAGLQGFYEAWLWSRPLQSPISAYCFGDGSGTACPCGNDAPLYSGGGCNNHESSARLVGQGEPSLSNDTLVLRASRMSQGSTLFFQGSTQASGGAGSAFGDGLRCASGAVIRLGIKPTAVPMQSPGGWAAYPGPTDPSVHVQGQIQSAGTRFYQAWYRDAMATYCTPATFNLTNGLSVTWAP